MSLTGAPTARRPDGVPMMPGVCIGDHLPMPLGRGMMLAVWGRQQTGLGGPPDVPTRGANALQTFRKLSFPYRPVGIAGDAVQLGAALDSARNLDEPFPEDESQVPRGCGTVGA